MVLSLIWLSLKHGNAKTMISSVMALSLVFVFVRFRTLLSAIPLEFAMVLACHIFVHGIAPSE
jgi:hypothetical protein